MQLHAFGELSNYRNRSHGFPRFRFSLLSVPDASVDPECICHSHLAGRVLKLCLAVVFPIPLNATTLGCPTLMQEEYCTGQTVVVDATFYVPES